MAALAAVAGLLTAAQAVVQATQRNRPSVALALMPWNSVANAAEGRRRWLAAPADPAVVRRAAALARRSLDHQLLNPVALQLLGFEADAAGDAGRARALITLADRMYRRDLTVGLWLIEDSVRAGRVDHALVYYDTALRTRHNAGQVLFPVLAAAADEASVRAGLAPYLRNQAPWVVPFVRYVIESGTNVPVVARMLVRYGQVRASSLQSQLLASLMATGAYEDAARFYLSMPGARASGLRSVAFAPADLDPRFLPVSWHAGDADGVAVGLEAGGSAGRRFHLSLPAEASEVALVKTLWLAPGTYRWVSEQQVVQRGGDATARWTIACLRSPAAPLRIANLDALVPHSAGRFTVPADCPVQAVGLPIASGSADAGLEMFVDRVRLAPAG